MRKGCLVYAEFKRNLRDESGATMVEFTAVVLLFFISAFGIIDAGYIYYQWNSATKAVQFGARLAAVSTPVPSDLKNYTGLSSTVLPGMPMPNYSWVCNGATSQCTSTLGGNTYTLAAMQAIVFGRDNAGVRKLACLATETNPRLYGMCNFYDKIDAGKVIIRYDYTGLGYAGRPGGPVPTITVSLQNITYNYFFLGALLGLNSVNLPGLATTVTGEDLSAAGAS